MIRPDTELLGDVAAASAAYLLTVLPEIAALSRQDACERLAGHFEAAVRAYLDGVCGWEVEYGGERSEPAAASP